ncbi:MAG: MOSC domain-containing protein [Parerythrobacter sp.]
MKVAITALCVGRPVAFRGGETSAIAKAPVAGRVAIGPLGLAGDEQADAKNHGGPHMTVHLYPRDHYARWREEIGNHPLLAADNAFGENIVASGIDETCMHIGDRFRLGTALLEVSQPRKPCWKIEHRFRREGMVAHILQSGWCGWYFRVLEPGAAQVGGMLERVSTGSAMTVAQAFETLWGNPKGATFEERVALADVAALTPGLREKLVR